MKKYQLDKRKVVAGLAPILIGGIVASYGIASYVINFIRINFGDGVHSLEVGSEHVLASIAWAGVGTLIFLAIAYWINYMMWRGESFHLTQDSIVYEFNFVVKRKITVPFNKINLVNTSRSLLDIIIGGSKLKIGSGSVATSMSEEIKLYFGKDKVGEWISLFNQISERAKKGEAIVVEDIERQIDNFGGKDEEKSNDYITLKRWDLVKMTLTGAGTAFAIVGVAVAYLMSLGMQYIISYIDGEPIDGALGLAFDPMWVFVGVIIVLVLIIGVLMLSQWLHYYNFKLYREGNNIKISYGLLSVQSHSVPIDKIHGIITKENIVRRIFGLGSMQLSVVGLIIGDGNKNITVPKMMPIGSVARLNEIRQKLLPEFASVDRQRDTVCQRSRLHYFGIPSIWIALIVVPLAICTYLMTQSVAAIAVVIVPLGGANIIALLQYGNAGVAIEHNFSVITYGSVVRNTMLCRTQSIVELTQVAGFIRQKDNIATLKLRVRGGLLNVSAIKVKHIYAPQIDQLN